MRAFKSTSLADQVFEKLENDIIQGTYPKGEILTELRLAEQLGVSRTPIREALRRLEHERLIEDTGKGSLVLGITETDLEDIMSIRERTEGLAAYYATVNMTDEGKKELLHWLIFEDSGLTMRSPLLMKVFFMGELSTKESIAFFEKFQIEMEKYLNGLQMADKYIDIFARQIGETEKALYWELTLDFGRRNMQMYIDWAKNCINKLEDLEKGRRA